MLRFRGLSLPVNSLNISLLFLCLLSCSAVQAAEKITLSTDQPTSTAGYYQLKWKLEITKADVVYVVEEMSDVDAVKKVIYQGADTATVLSGKHNGSYTYTVHTNDGLHVSDPVTVRVAHHSLATAFLFFSLGAVVFISVLIAIYFGNKDQVVNAG